MLFYLLAPILVALAFVALVAGDYALWRWRDKRAEREAREWEREREGVRE